MAAFLEFFEIFIWQFNSFHEKWEASYYPAYTAIEEIMGKYA